MSRTHARTPAGECVEGSVPNPRGSRRTLLAGLGLRGLVAPLVLEGSLTTDILLPYTQQSLLLSLNPGDILVLDKARVHSKTALPALFESKGVTLLFLPPYSPDLNSMNLQGQSQNVSTCRGSSNLRATHPRDR